MRLALQGDRELTEADLLKRMEWRRSEHEVPDGPWHKDFGSFKSCGDGERPKIFLLQGRQRREPL